MKKSLVKILTVTAIILVVVGGAKIANDQLSQAQASTNDSPICGANSGWIWNGQTCVNTCDQYHPWDKTNHRCSGNWYGGTNYGQTVVNPNCQAYYGSNYYFNGQTCVQINTLANANYYGNPYNGGTQNPVYGTVNYNNLATSYYNNNSNQIIYPNTNNNYYPNTPVNPVPNYNQNNYCDYTCQNSYASNAPSVQDYYTITVTNTTYSGGTPVYLGSYGNNYYPNTNGNYYGNGTYYGSNYNNSNYYSGTCYDTCYNTSDYDSNVDYYGNSYTQNSNYDYLGSTADDNYPSWEDFQDGNYLNYPWYGNAYPGSYTNFQ